MNELKTVAAVEALGLATSFECVYGAGRLVEVEEEQRGQWWRVEVTRCESLSNLEALKNALQGARTRFYKPTASATRDFALNTPQAVVWLAVALARVKGGGSVGVKLTPRRLVYSWRGPVAGKEARVKIALPPTRAISDAAAAAAATWSAAAAAAVERALVGRADSDDLRRRLAAPVNELLELLTRFEQLLCAFAEGRDVSALRERFSKTASASVRRMRDLFADDDDDDDDGEDDSGEDDNGTVTPAPAPPPSAGRKRLRADAPANTSRASMRRGTADTVVATATKRVKTHTAPIKEAGRSLGLPSSPAVSRRDFGQLSASTTTATRDLRQASSAAAAPVARSETKKRPAQAKTAAAAAATQVRTVRAAQSSPPAAFIPPSVRPPPILDGRGAVAESAIATFLAWNAKAEAAKEAKATQVEAAKVARAAKAEAAEAKAAKAAAAVAAKSKGKAKAVRPQSEKKKTYAEPAPFGAANQPATELKPAHGRAAVRTKAGGAPAAAAAAATTAVPPRHDEHANVSNGPSLSATCARTIARSTAVSATTTAPTTDLLTTTAPTATTTPTSPTPTTPAPTTTALHDPNPDRDGKESNDNNYSNCSDNSSDSNYSNCSDNSSDSGEDVITAEDERGPNVPASLAKMVTRCIRKYEIPDNSIETLPGNLRARPGEWALARVEPALPASCANRIFVLGAAPPSLKRGSSEGAVAAAPAAATVGAVAVADGGMVCSAASEYGAIGKLGAMLWVLVEYGLRACLLRAPAGHRCLRVLAYFNVPPGGFDRERTDVLLLRMCGRELVYDAFFTPKVAARVFAGDPRTREFPLKPCRPDARATKLEDMWRTAAKEARKSKFADANMDVDYANSCMFDLVCEIYHPEVAPPPQQVAT